MKGITNTVVRHVAPPPTPTPVPARTRVLGRPPRILLLTSGLGCGHVRAADAVERALLRLEPSTIVHQVDFWTLMNAGVAAEIQKKYLELVLETPDLYARLHGLDERTWRRVIENDIAPPVEVVELIELLTRNDAPDRRSLSSLLEWALGPYPSDLLLYPTACAAMPTSSSERAGSNVALLRRALLKWGMVRLQSRMEQRLADFAPDAIVATQMVPAALVSTLKQSTRRWQRVPLVGVLTDFGAHDYWVQPGIDCYCVPHESVCGPPLPVATRGPEVVVTGVPLMPAFERLPDRAAARRDVGLDPDDRRPVVLVVGGGLGIGLDDIIAGLSSRDTPQCRVIAMSGQNADARARLRRLERNTGGSAAALTVVEWTEHMERYLVAADLVVGKSGGLSVAEALACGRPMLVTRTLQGQEGFNVRFLERHGLGRPASTEELPGAVRASLENHERLQCDQQRAWAAGRRDGARRVAEQTLDLAGRRARTAHARVAGRDGGW